MSVERPVEWRLWHAWRSRGDVAALDACRRRLASAGIVLADATSSADAQALKLHGIELLEFAQRDRERLIDLRDVAAEQHWAERVDPRAWAFMADGDAVFGIPIVIHRANCLWSSRSLADQLPPADGLLHWLHMASHHVTFPLVVGRDPWRIGVIFEMLLAAAGGDAYQRLLTTPQPADDRVELLRPILSQMSQLREFVDERLLELSWSEALSHVADDGAGAMVMGDWAASSGLCELTLVDLGPRYRTNVHVVDFFTPVGANGEEALRRVAGLLADPTFQSELAGLKGARPAVYLGRPDDSHEASVPSFVFDQCCALDVKQSVLPLIAEHFLERRAVDESAVRIGLALSKR